jgi:small multidrug resistance pump
MIMTPVASGWLFLGIAIIFGVLGTIFMKLSHGLQKLKPVLFLLIFYTISFIAMTLAMQHIELSIIYAVWSGMGTILVVIISILFFNESASFQKIFFLLLIIIGVIGIHLSDSLF